MPPLPTTRHARLRARAAFTLLEIVVTLVLLGLAAAIVTPAFRRDQPDEGLPAILAAAREVAVRRAQTLVLRVDDRGAWRLTTAEDTTSLGSGLLRDRGRARSFRITPLGSCFSEGQAIAPDWDAIACAPIGEGTNR